MAPLREQERKRFAVKQADLTAADSELRQQMLRQLEQRRAAARVERQKRIARKKRGATQPPKLPPATRRSKLTLASQPGHDPREDGWLGTWTPEARSANSVRTVQGGGFETNRRRH